MDKRKNFVNLLEIIASQHGHLSELKEFLWRRNEAAAGGNGS
jgi:hypothetical protein